MNAQNAKFYMVRGMTDATINSFEAVGKNPLKARRFWGFLILTLEIGDLMTGDPLSLNGAFKIALWLSGSGLIVWGALAAKQRLTWRMWRSHRDA